MPVVVSMSGLGRVEKCLPSVILSRTTKQPSADAERGSAIHRYLKLVPSIGRDAALSHIEEEYREACATIELERLPLNVLEWSAEVAWAYHWRNGTAREIGRGIERAYDELIDVAQEIPGAADVTGLTPTHVIILDYKSGYADQGPPANSWQLKTYALAAARAYDRDHAFVGFIRLRDDGTPWFDVAELGPLELDQHEERIRELMLRTEAAAGERQGPLDTNEGGWCKLCPAFHNCPAKIALAAAMARPTELFKGDFPTLTEDNAPAVLTRIAAVEEVLKRMKKDLREFAFYRPVYLGGGHVYGPVEVVTETIEVAVGGRIIANLYGAEVADKATEIVQKMTWSALEEALKPKLAKAKADDPKTKTSMAGMLREAREVLRKNDGALTEKRRIDVKVHKPSKSALPPAVKPAPASPPRGIVAEALKEVPNENPMVTIQQVGQVIRALEPKLPRREPGEDG